MWSVLSGTDPVLGILLPCVYNPTVNPPQPPEVIEALLAACRRLGIRSSDQLSDRPTDQQVEQLAIHFGLLQLWNRKINLTAVREPGEIVPRHFEESLFLATLIPPPDGLALDVGSGAGFPALPLKVFWPAVEMILLEPNAKKATFLKEVIRRCGLTGVRVMPARLETFAEEGLRGRISLITMRAVAISGKALSEMAGLLEPSGVAALYLGESDAIGIAKQASFQWEPLHRIPGADRRCILIGRQIVR